MLEFLPPYIYIHAHTDGGLHKERELIWQLQRQPSHPFWGPHERGSDFFFFRVGKVCKILMIQFQRDKDSREARNFGHAN